MPHIEIALKGWMSVSAPHSVGIKPTRRHFGTVILVMEFDGGRAAGTGGRDSPQIARSAKAAHTAACLVT
jgi:hypothetical protein